VYNDTELRKETNITETQMKQTIRKDVSKITIIHPFVGHAEKEQRLLFLLKKAQAQIKKHTNELHDISICCMFSSG
jgi:fido (protein-threonine AMPylation protein)